MLSHGHLFPFHSKPTSFLLQLKNFPFAIWCQPLHKYSGHSLLPSQRPDSVSSSLCWLPPDHFHPFQIWLTIIHPSFPLPGPYSFCPILSTSPTLTSQITSVPITAKTGQIQSLFCPHFTIRFQTCLQETRTEQKTKVWEKKTSDLQQKKL